jgi:hypothetical protein
MLVSFALCRNNKIIGIAKYFEDLETVLKHINNFIPKEKVEKIEKNY